MIQDDDSNLVDEDYSVIDAERSPISPALECLRPIHPSR